jgi:hypothetical protein
MQNPATGNPVRKTRFCPRLQILNEVAAGWLWLLLPLPADSDRDEVEAMANRLVKVMMDGQAPNRIALEIARMQEANLCVPVDIRAARSIAARIAQLVRSL